MDLLFPAGASWTNLELQLQLFWICYSLLEQAWPTWNCNCNTPALLFPAGASWANLQLQQFWICYSLLELAWPTCNCNCHNPGSAIPCRSYLGNLELQLQQPCLCYFLLELTGPIWYYDCNNPGSACSYLLELAGPICNCNYPGSTLTCWSWLGQPGTATATTLALLFPGAICCICSSNFYIFDLLLV